jgi:hypothetical protein
LSPDFSSEKLEARRLGWGVEDMKDFLAKAWRTFRGWPTPVQVIVAVIALVVVAGALGSETETEPVADAPTEVEQDEPSEEPKPEPEPDQDEPEEQKAAYSEDDPEYKLASIDAGYPLDLDDRSIGRYGRLLNRLERKCPDADREFVGDMAVRSTQLLADEGVEATVLEMLRGADRALSGGTQQLGVECSEVFASLVVLMR